jgi:hypothetical protein
MPSPLKYNNVQDRLPFFQPFLSKGKMIRIKASRLLWIKVTIDNIQPNSRKDTD